jgi:hypothetical protein
VIPWCERALVASSHAGCASTPRRARLRRRAPGTNSGGSPGRRMSPRSSNGAARPWPVPLRRRRPWRPGRRAGRPPSWPRAPSALPHALTSGGAQAKAPHRTRASLGSPVRSPGGAPRVRPVSPPRGGSSAPPLHSTTPSAPRRSGELGIQAQPRRHVGALPARPAGIGRCTRSPHACTPQGAAAGADRRLAGVCGPGGSASPSPHGACGTMAGPTRPPPPEPDRTRGVPLLGRDAGVRPPSTMAHRAQPDGRAPAPAPTPGTSVSLV